MRKIIGTLVVLAILAVLGGAAFIYSGAYDIAATARHWPITYWVLQTVRDRSIEMRAAGVAPPANLDYETRVVAGTAHFAEHCAECHSAPGVEADDMAGGMYPKPPVLTDVAKRYTPGELFWILKNGIKMSGMPSWADHGDDQLWNVVAFLEKLPGMTPDHYGKLVVAAQAAGGHQMQGSGGQAATGMPGMDMGGGRIAADPAQPGSQGGGGGHQTP